MELRKYEYKFPKQSLAAGALTVLLSGLVLCDVPAALPPTIFYFKLWYLVSYTFKMRGKVNPSEELVRTTLSLTVSHFSPMICLLLATLKDRSPQMPPMWWNKKNDLGSHAGLTDFHVGKHTGHHIGQPSGNRKGNYGILH